MSQAFPVRALVRFVIASPPLSKEWTREHEAYQVHRWLTPEIVVRSYHAGSLMVWREEPAGTIWLRPAESWQKLAADSGILGGC